MNNDNRSTGIEIFKGILSQPAKATTDNIADLVIKGEANPAYVGVVLKKMHKIYEDLKEKRKDAFDIIKKDTLSYKEGTKKSFKIFGATVTETVRSYWDYSQTEDPVWQALKEIEKDVKDHIKLREAELQNKAEVWEKQSVPTNGGINFKIPDYVVDVKQVPKLIWEDAYAEISTNPPIKKGKESLSYRL